MRSADTSPNPVAVELLAAGPDELAVTRDPKRRASDFGPAPQRVSPAGLDPVFDAGRDHAAIHEQVQVLQHRGDLERSDRNALVPCPDPGRAVLVGDDRAESELEGTAA